MLELSRVATAAVAAVAVSGACGGESESGGGGGAGDRGGPDSLVGFEWRSEPITDNGFEFVLGFRFDDDSITASNTCNGELTATVEAPVRYRYTADVPAAGRRDEEDGGRSCFVEVVAGAFDFEIVDRRLRMTVDGETTEFSPVGPVAGLYGEWTAEAEGVGTLRWSMGGGRITATNECDNGLSATVEVDADFVNRLEFPMAAENVVEDEFGSTCSIGIAEQTATYRFDGDTLVYIAQGQETRFEAQR